MALAQMQIRREVAGPRIRFVMALGGESAGDPLRIATIGSRIYAAFLHLFLGGVVSGPVDPRVSECCRNRDRGLRARRRSSLDQQCLHHHGGERDCCPKLVSHLSTAVGRDRWLPRRPRVDRRGCVKLGVGHRDSVRQNADMQINEPRGAAWPRQDRCPTQCSCLRPPSPSFVDGNARGSPELVPKVDLS